MTNEQAQAANKVDLLCAAFEPPPIDLPVVPLVEGVCAISGKRIDAGVAIRAIVTSATNQPHEIFKVPHTQYVSLEAARLFKCMKAGGMTGNLLAVLLNGQPAGYKPMVSRESASKAGRACWHDLVLSLPLGALTVAIFSTDTKRRFWPFAYLSVVGEAWTVYLHDDSVSQNITVSISRLRACLALLAQIYDAGFSKQAMREGLFDLRAWQQSGLPWQTVMDLESQLVVWRSTPEFQLALFIVQRTQETQDQ